MIDTLVDELYNSLCGSNYLTESKLDYLNKAPKISKTTFDAFHSSIQKSFVGEENLKSVVSCFLSVTEINKLTYECQMKILLKR